MITPERLAERICRALEIAPRHGAESIREIRDMMAAIRRRDADAAFAASLHHIQEAARVALAGL